jgi:hypothetical protein
MEASMPTRKSNESGPQVTVRFPESISYFMLSPGDTLGDLATQLAGLSEKRGATPQAIALTFPRPKKVILH